MDAFFLALKQNRLEDAYHILNPPESIMSFDDFKKSKLANYKIKDWQIFGLACVYFRTENEDGWRSFLADIADQSDQFSHFRYSDYLNKEPNDENGICHCNENGICSALLWPQFSGEQKCLLGGLLCHFLSIEDTIDGGDVLPGFKLAVKQISPTV